MNRQAKGRSGFAVAVVLLVSVVALGAAVSAASVAAVSARRVANLEQRSTSALFAAESGLNTLIARSLTEAYSFEGYTSVENWLAPAPTGIGLATYSLPNGATVSLTVEREDANIATIRSVGQHQGATRVILQDFDVLFDLIRPTMFADAALVTKTALKTNSRVSRLIGLDYDESAWAFASELRFARAGDFARRTVEGVTTLYRVLSTAGGQFRLESRPGGVIVDDLPGSTPVELIPFAVGRPIDENTGLSDTTTPPAYAEGAFGGGTTSTIFVTNGEVFPVGSEIRLGGDPSNPEVANIGTVVDPGWDEETGALTVAWQSWSYEVAEGTPVRKKVLSAIAEAGCPDEATHTEEKLPQGCEDADDGVELGDLWAETFSGITKTALRNIAQGEYDVTEYPDWEGIPTGYFSGGAWPTTVEGLTWIDGAQTQGRNNQLCGTGIVILNTGASLDDDPDARINLTTAGCDFSGILFIIGQLKLVGNLDNFSGAIFVEGPGGVTEAEGTGSKSIYNPIAIREALDLLPPVREFEGLFAPRTATWRISQLGQP